MWYPYYRQMRKYTVVKKLTSNGALESNYIKNFSEIKAATGGVLGKTVFLKISQILQESTCIEIPALGLQPIKKRFQQRCFSVKLAKFLIKVNLKNIYQRLILEKHQDKMTDGSFVVVRAVSRTLSTKIMMELFCETSYRPEAPYCFHKKAPS